MAQWNLRQQLEEAEAQRRLAAGLSATADDSLMDRPIVLDDTAAPADQDAARTGHAAPNPNARATALPLWQGATGPVAAAVDDRATGSAPATGAGRTGDPSGRTAPPPPERVATRQPIKDRCPHCGGKVRLDRFDLVDAVAHMSCTDCGFTYQARSPKL